MAHGMLTEAEAREEVRQRALSVDNKNAYSVFEFWVPRFNTRADVAIVGDALRGFEIKTARDKLNRLPHQVEAYSNVFDFCSAVVADRHVEPALELLPEWWGVMVISANSHIDHLRQPRQNPMINPEVLVRLLWREEAFAALDRVGGCPDPAMNRSNLWTHLMSRLHLDELREVVRHALLIRDGEAAAIPSKRFS
jgi:hypothetical protein